MSQPAALLVFGIIFFAWGLYTTMYNISRENRNQYLRPDKCWYTQYTFTPKRSVFANYSFSTAQCYHGSMQVRLVESKRIFQIDHSFVCSPAAMEAQAQYYREKYRPSNGPQDEPGWLATCYYDEYEDTVVFTKHKINYRTAVTQLQLGVVFIAVDMLFRCLLCRRVRVSS